MNERDCFVLYNETCEQHSPGTPFVARVVAPCGVPARAHGTPPLPQRHLPCTSDNRSGEVQMFICSQVTNMSCVPCPSVVVPPQ